jgi:hypothetical protein
MDDPDNVEYWNALAGRVITAAVRRARSNSVEWLAGSRRGWTGTALLAMAALVSLMLFGRPAGDVASTWSNALKPADELGKTMTESDHAPSIGALLLEPQGRPQ